MISVNPVGVLAVLQKWFGERLPPRSETEMGVFHVGEKENLPR